MSTDTNQPPPEIRDIQSQLPDAHKGTKESFDVKAGEGYSEKLVDAIEMIGEEKAAGFEVGPSLVTPGMRYLHSSRTIHQLVTDRNRAAGIYLAVASLVLTASGAIYNANPQGELIVPMVEIQRWCMPIAFATLAILALLFFGGHAIHSFVATMIFGVVLVGTYTSVFIAAPILIYLGVGVTRGAADEAPEPTPTPAATQASTTARTPARARRA